MQCQYSLCRGGEELHKQSLATDVKVQVTDVSPQRKELAKVIATALEATFGA
jgi:hypothetical protein